MSVTVATTTIDLVWQEVDLVSFTAGTMADIDSMKTEVESKLQRGTLSGTSSPTTAEVGIWLVRAKEEFMETGGYSFARRFVYATATAATYRFALPPDFGGGGSYLRDITNNARVRYTDRETFDRLYPDPSEFGSGSLKRFTVKGRELWTYPAGNGARLELEYTRTGDDNTATDVSYIPERYRWKIVDMALIEAFESLQEYDKATYYQRKGTSRIALAKKSDSKQKMSHKRRALSWLEV